MLAWRHLAGIRRVRKLNAARPPRALTLRAPLSTIPPSGRTGTAVGGMGNAMRAYAVGDRVIYIMPKVSAHPGQNAQHVHPSMGGENYDYLVEKFWTVTAIPSVDTIEITTRRGKKRQLRTDDPRLRRASWLEKLLRHSRFPVIEPDR